MILRGNKTRANFSPTVANSHSHPSANTCCCSSERKLPATQTNASCNSNSNRSNSSILSQNSNSQFQQNSHSQSQNSNSQFQKPQSHSALEFVQASMSQMDAQWGTHFAQWIRNSAHANYTAKRLRPLMTQYPQQRAIEGLKWLLLHPECDWESETMEEFVAEVIQDLPSKTAKKIVKAIFE